MLATRYITFHGREDKLVEIVSLFHDYLSDDILDVGSDARSLSTVI